MPLDPWSVSALDYPESASVSERLRFFLQFAVLAPSIYNVQPWQFRITEQAVELWLDRADSLPVVDPWNRQLILSCGAALTHLKLAVRYYRFTPHVQLVPSPDHPHLLARLRVGPGPGPTPEEDRLFRAIPRRRTYRLPFDDRPVSPSLETAIRDLAQREETILSVIPAGESREPLAELVAEGTKRHGNHSAFRWEYARWVRSNRNRRRDGLPGYAFGAGLALSYALPTLLRLFSWGTAQAQQDKQSALDAPLLLVLGTATDSPEAWLATGQTLATILLMTCAQGYHASYLNGPITIPELRTKLSEQIAAAEPNPMPCPQLLLRIGHGQTMRPTPRHRPREIQFIGLANRHVS
ncbi:MAG: hypothetical protein JW818_11305 [Pirellulales bacterium]|nr:hypothetical protein [Pirellulales bacterium]